MARGGFDSPASGLYDARLMCADRSEKALPESLLESVLPEQWRERACAGWRFDGEVPIESLARLEQALGADQRPGAVAEVSVVGERDAHGRVVFRGQASAGVQAECQRCLRSMALPLKASIVWHVVPSAGEGADERSDIAGDAAVSLLQMLEDELLLALPFAPKHAATDECSVEAAVSDDVAADAEQKQTPFANLRALMKGDE